MPTEIACLLVSLNLCLELGKPKRSLQQNLFWLPLVWREADWHQGACVKLISLKDCDSCGLIHQRVVDTKQGYVIIVPLSLLSLTKKSCIPCWSAVYLWVATLPMELLMNYKLHDLEMLHPRWVSWYQWIKYVINIDMFRSNIHIRESNMLTELACLYQIYYIQGWNMLAVLTCLY